MSIAPAWCDFKLHCDTIGPDRGRPPRPAQCVFCDDEHVWFNGWRRVLITLMVDGQAYRPDDWVPATGADVESAAGRGHCARPGCIRTVASSPTSRKPRRSRTC